MVPPPSRSRGPRPPGGPALFFLAALSLLSLPSPAAVKQAEEKTRQAAKPKATLVGSETCSTCHEDIYKSFLKSPHVVVEEDARRGWKGNACESCHGPGSVHAETTVAADILNPPKQTAAEADKGCLGCHLNQPTHVGRIQGGHARSQASCAGCHSVHKEGAGALVASRPAAVSQLCVGCHTPALASFRKPHSHRVTEGAMSCVDCHNPHGSLLASSMRTVSANEPGCLKCHGDKRGPFAFEHAPVRLEGCQSCHEPHGSANPRMLKRHEVSILCLECHANLPLATVPSAVPAGGLGGIPPAFHDLRSARFRNCTICHVKIHGSHVSRALLR